MSLPEPVDRFRSRLASLNCDGRRGFALAALLGLLLAGQLGGEAARLALRYERTAVASGEWWRLLSGHFVHLGLEHTLLNALGLILMWALFARDFRPLAWLAILAATLAAIDLGLLRDSTVQWYVGSSGALHGVLAAGTVAHLKRGEFDGWVLALFLLAKLAYEQFVGALPLTAGGAVVVGAHLYGALGGALAAAALRPRAEPL